MTALLLVPLFFLAAFAIDVGYIALGKAELQNAADASALAGASQLLDRSTLTGVPVQTDRIAKARDTAVNFASLNKAGGVNLTVSRNDSNDVNGDIVIGYMAEPRTFAGVFQYNSFVPTSANPTMLFYLPTVASTPSVLTPPPVSTSYNSYNSVQVKTQRSTNRNGAWPLFFGGLTGRSTVDLSTTAVATYEDNIKGFRIFANGPNNSLLLPFAMDVNTFGAIAAGLSVLDLWKYDPTVAVPPNTYASRVSIPLLNQTLPGDPRLDPRNALFNPKLSAIVAAAVPGDGIKEALLVPLVLPGSPAVYVGNFGTLYIGNAAKSDIIKFEDQIVNGPTNGDFLDMGGSLKLTANGTLAMSGSGIVDSTLLQTLLSIKGQPRVIPLYQPTVQPFLPAAVTGDIQYTIVGFGGIIILEVLEVPGTPATVDVLTGKIIPAGPKTLKLFVQPEIVVDSTGIGGGSLLSNGGAKTSTFVYRPLAVTQ